MLSAFFVGIESLTHFQTHRLTPSLLPSGSNNHTLIKYSGLTIEMKNAPYFSNVRSTSFVIRTYHPCFIVDTSDNHGVCYSPYNVNSMYVRRYHMISSQTRDKQSIKIHF